MNFFDRPIAFTDVETTGLKNYRGADWNPASGTLMPWHEICEIGLVLVSQPKLEIISKLNARIRIEKPGRFSPKAKEVNGYNERDWENAIGLEEALKRYDELVQGAIFAAHNATFDWGFLEAAFALCDVTPKLDYHRIDLWSYAVAILDAKGYKLASYRLNDLAKFLSLPEEPMPHRAINGAMLAYQVYKALREFKPAPVVNASSGNGHYF